MYVNNLSHIKYKYIIMSKINVGKWKYKKKMDQPQKLDWKNGFKNEHQSFNSPEIGEHFACYCYNFHIFGYCDFLNNTFENSTSKDYFFLNKYNYEWNIFYHFLCLKICII